MSEGYKRHSHKNYAQRAYKYYRENGFIGIVENGWSWLLHKPDRLTALSTFAIFLATAVAVGVGVAQWHALRGQLTEMINSSGQVQRAIKAANDQVAAAIDANNTAKAAIILANRAWIAVRRMTFDTPPSEAQPMHLLITFENTGKTPAFNVVMGDPEFSRPDDSIFASMPSDVGPILKAFGQNRSCETVGPLLPNAGGETIYPGYSDKPPNFLLEGAGNADEDIMHSKKTLVIKGCFGYRTFGMQHRSPFCFFLHPSQADRWRFLLCGIGPDPD